MPGISEIFFKICQHQHNFFGISLYGHGDVYTYLSFLSPLKGFKGAFPPSNFHLTPHKQNLEFRLFFQHPILDSIVESIPACHAGDRGSIPRRGG